jgi:hypothetical protein
MCADIFRHVDWCSLDTGLQRLTGLDGNVYDVYVTARRDKSMWIRLGDDKAASDWNRVNEKRRGLQTTLLSPTDISLLASVNFSDACVTSDLRFHVADVTLRRADVSMTHASTNIVVRSTRDGAMHVVRLRRLQLLGDCRWSNVNMTLTLDGQGVRICTVSRSTARCFLPLQPTEGGGGRYPILLQSLDLDPINDPASVPCTDEDDSSVTSLTYTMSGSYYYTYLQVAQCRHRG